jgi:two-component system NtrC family sensor kinase
MRMFKGTSRRITLSFAMLVLLFGLAAGAIFAALSDLHRGLHDVRRHEEQVRTVLELASAVRDQYAHQAHTVILGNTSHLELYEAARARVQTLLGDVRAQQTEPRSTELVDEIDRTSAEFDAAFREKLLPAVLAGDRGDVQREHDRVQALVSQVEARMDDLAQRSLASIGRFEEHAGAVQHTALQWTLIFLAAAPLCAVAMGVYLRRSIARPLERLQEGAARIASGELDTRIAVDRPDEFGELAHKFNAMTSALREHQELLLRTERLAGIGRLAAGVAHEINNPLGVILGYVRLLRREATGRLASDLAIVEEEAVRCQEIVEGLLDLSRPLQGSGEPVDLRRVCEDVVARLRESGNLDGAILNVDGHGVAAGSHARLRQIAMNLIKNACEAAGAGGRVSVRISADRSGVTLSITDDGPGIAPEARGHLFEPFFTTKPSGTGLGLAVSQAIAHAHGGRIEAREATPRGTMFTVRLPASAQEAA